MVLSGWRIGFRGRKFSQLLMSKKFSAQIRGNRYFRRIRSYQMWFIGNPHCEVLMWEILLLAHGPTKDLGKSDTTMGFPQSIHRQWLPQRRTFETLLSVALGGGCREDLAGHRKTTPQNSQNYCIWNKPLAFIFIFLRQQKTAGYIRQSLPTNSFAWTRLAPNLSHLLRPSIQ